MCLVMVDYTTCMHIYSRYEGDLWLWDLDWSVNQYKLNKPKKKPSQNNKVKRRMCYFVRLKKIVLYSISNSDLLIFHQGKNARTSA